MRLKFVRDIVLFLVLGIGFVFNDYYKIAIDSKGSFNSSLAANAEENSGSNVVEMVQVIQKRPFH